jgi:triacylglycerol lipase
VKKTPMSILRIVTMLMATVLVGPMVLATPTAGADDSEYIAFYTPPEQVNGNPGDIIKSEPARLVYEPSGQLGGWVANGTRIMYQTTNAKGQPVAATAMYLEPTVPWTGKGPRPLIAYAPGPYGIGEQCAPSRLMSQGIHFSQGFDLTINYEEGFMATMVARGYAVVVADGVGMGVHIPGGPEFANRLSAGTALLDAARASLNLPGTSLQRNSAVAFWGWLTGGHAAGSAAEQAASYAPELNVVGTALNAPVSNLLLVPPFLDGNLLVGALGYVLNGVVFAYPETAELLMGALTPRGLHFVQWSSYICLVQSVADFGFRHFYFPDNSGWFNVPPDQLFGTDPVKSLLLAQNLGTSPPRGPVFISQNRFDAFNPYQASTDLATQWCGLGADVELNTNEQPPFLNKAGVNTLLPYFVDGESMMQWLNDRFNGLPTTPNCGNIYQNV